MASTAPSLQVKLREPVNDRQAAFFESTAKRKCLRCGRRGAKTTGIARKCVESFLKGKRVLYAVPTADQLETWWLEVRIALADLIDAGVVEKNETRHSLTWKQGMGMPEHCRIRGKTAWNADTLRGDYADDLYFDEWQLMDEDAWEVVGSPMLMDNGGDATFAYTPPSLRSRSVTKARNPRHAAELFKAFELGYSSRQQWIEAGRPKTRRMDPDPNVVTFHWTSYDNPTLNQSAVDEVAGSMTSLVRRQEIMAEDIDEVPGALWKQSTIDNNRRKRPAELTRVAIAIDPAGTAKKTSDETGIGAAGLGPCNHGRDDTDDTTHELQDHIFVLDDVSGHYTPHGWAEAAVRLYDKLEADVMVAETNHGGDLVADNIRNYLRSEGRSPLEVNVQVIHASRGKDVRAEPIAAQDERGAIHHVKVFTELEEQMVVFTGSNSSEHDDRVDWRVYACAELLGKSSGGGFIGGWT